MVAGPPCSGKSYVARILARRTGIRHLEMDAIRVRLLPNSRHAKEHRDIAYRAMHLAAQILLEMDHSVIVDATYMPAEHRRELEQVAEVTGSLMFLVECKVSPSMAVSRFSGRSAHAAVDLTPDRVDWLASHYPYSGKGFTYDSSECSEPSMEQICNYLLGGEALRNGEWSKTGFAAGEELGDVRPPEDFISSGVRQPVG